MARAMIKVQTKPRSRRRPSGITVMVSAEERQEMRRAADQAEMPLSMFVRMITLAAIRRGETLSTVVTKASRAA